ncbi:F-box domain [Macleaya cordata]|uniref:F-box domain n=1 Tax=Macleaya cordata TaxID=56857 RepID=A0A200RAU0_MACCD|nr:F-box domain [Macleaya cordata]
MGKVFPKDKESTARKQKRRLRALDARKEYVKPGALAQLRYSRVSSTKSCTDLGKKRIVVLDSSKKTNNDLALQTDVIVQTPPSTTTSSPERMSSRLIVGPIDMMLKQSKLPRTPKTPRREDWESSESRLESLPMDLLVKILCHLHHDQLRAVFHVSQKIRKAVLLARQFHFNYTTPDRVRQEMLRTKTPLPTEHWPFLSKGEGKGIFCSSPHTPKAPRHGPRPPSRYKRDAEVRQITAVLFQESAFPSRCIVPPGLPKSVCKSFASNRALFCEDELCQAVAQNKLR